MWSIWKSEPIIYWSPLFQVVISQFLKSATAFFFSLYRTYVSQFSLFLTMQGLVELKYCIKPMRFKPQLNPDEEEITLTEGIFLLDDGDLSKKKNRFGVSFLLYFIFEFMTNFRNFFYNSFHYSLSVKSHQTQKSCFWCRDLCVIWGMESLLLPCWIGGETYLRNHLWPPRISTNFG